MSSRLTEGKIQNNIQQKRFKMSWEVFYIMIHQCKGMNVLVKTGKQLFRCDDSAVSLFFVFVDHDSLAATTSKQVKAAKICREKLIFQTGHSCHIDLHSAKCFSHKRLQVGWGWVGHKAHITVTHSAYWYSSISGISLASFHYFILTYTDSNDSLLTETHTNSHW